MSNALPRHNANGGDTPPKKDFDPEKNHITVPVPANNSNPSSNLQHAAVPHGTVMWAGPDPTGEGARSAGLEVPVSTDSGNARAVSGRTAAPLLSRAGTGLAPSGQPLQAPPAMATNSTTKHNGIEAERGSVKAFANGTIPPALMASTEQASMHAAAPPNATSDQEAARAAVDDAKWLTDNEAFAAVKLARQLLVDNDATRQARKDTPASERTVRDYQKKCDQVARELEWIDPGSPNPLLEVMLRHGRSKQTFQALKSALRWQALGHLREALKDQDRLQRAERGSLSWKRAVLALRRSVHDLKHIDSLDRTECLLWLDQAAKPAQSKRRILPRLPQGWQDRFLEINSQSRTYRHAGALLLYCGLRPAELENGVRLRWTPRGVRVLIAGAKVRETAGQPWRTFLLDPQQLPVWFVEELKQSGRTVVSAKPDPLRTHLYKQSQAVLNPQGHKRGKDLILSAYVFRHALVTELRENGWETEQIAALVGESSAQTLSYYGTRLNSGSRANKPPVAIIPGSVRAPRTVRPVDYSGLKAQQAKKTSSGPKRLRH